MKINLTDQELNEWVSINVMEWEKKSIPVPSYGKDMAIVAYWDKEGRHCGQLFNPSKDLNHAYLMEEKIREMGRIKDYQVNLARQFDFEYIPDITSWKIFEMIHASARQRCEAAWLTFQNK